ncbi:hypothetical protein SAMN02745165_03198 [Malonomonas rubra DSM 5091]|uniref:SH3b domain-containing protein n=1 Tax=Malonomonas rubra DSM 5091 TaxID=1122189 RepID=A0A1M6M7D1_MALRU|nr:SH3 domain-containing protein [Malonomonas rubra]SHJ79335.1 hypothetical protein SAMN02745165_03198 [Malonomonas rubra DSM 5091]
MKLGFGKAIGIIASITSIVGFAFVVYDKTQIDPNREQLNRLTKLIETQEEQLKVQRELVSLAKRNNFLTQSSAPKTDQNDTKKSAECQIESSHKIIVASINVREDAPTLNSFAPKIDSISEGEKFEIIRSKSAGIFGFGTVWYEIKYCKNNEPHTGWISSKLENGSNTTKKL